MSPASNRWRAALVALLACLTFVAAHAWRPTHRLADSRPKIDAAQLFPSTFGDWRVDDRMPVQLVSPDVQAQLDKIYNQVLNRTYVHTSGARVMLSVAYGGDQSDATRAHRPEVCYPAQGFEIRSNRNAVVPLQTHELPVRRLIARLQGRNEPITYWITVGEEVTTSGPQQKLAQLRYSVRGVIPDGMLVRVSSIDADAERAFALQSGFIQQMADALRASQRSLVMGKVGT